MRITDQALLELLARSTGGEWGIASDENVKFFIYRKESSPIKYIIRDIPEDVSNYDMRLMAMARELAIEVLELRKKQRVIFDKL